ncbi:MAG: c-type cytochrome, partial [Polyangiaceae bacterium]
LFNGAEGSLTGANALHASVGQRVRIFVGNGGPNLVSSFHIIGEIFDRAYREGGITPDSNVQTTLIPAGGATYVEFSPRVPGDYTMLDHSIFRAFSKGAVGTLTVDGAPNTALYSDQGPDTPFLGGDTAAPAQTAPAAVPQTKEELIANGEGVFKRTCAACHQVTGLGSPPAIPPLAGSDFLMADKTRSIRIVLGGLKGPVTVKDQTFSSMEMPSHAFLSDVELASALSYARNSWGNSGDAVTPAEVATERASGVHTVLAER